jgi:hypothetical protein
LESLQVQAEPPAEVIVVGERPGLGRRAPWSVPVRRIKSATGGTAGARNAGAAAARGHLLAFLTGDALLAPTWTAALAQAFRGGATIVAGAICSAAPGREDRIPVRRQHDLAGRLDFLPSASAVNLAITRELFDELCGFDPATRGAEDRDLTFRAQLAGHNLCFAPEATVFLKRESMIRRVRLGVRFDRAQPAMRRKYAGFVFHDAVRAWRRRPLPGMNGRSLRSVHVAAEAVGSLELFAGRRWWRGIGPSSGFQELAAGPLESAPAGVVLVRSRRDLTRIGKGMPQLSLPPPGLLREALPHWNEPAPWSMRLARSAVRHGWPLSVDVVARRLEHQRCETWGQACLVLHGIYAWAEGKAGFALVAEPATEPLFRSIFASLPVLGVDGAVASRPGPVGEDRLVAADRRETAERGLDLV